MIIYIEMKAKSLIFVSLVALIAISANAGLNVTDFSRYEVILSRQPFGAPPERVAEPTAPQPAAEDQFKNYRLVGITRGEDEDVSVGIVDLGANPPNSIFLGLGGSDQGLTLVDADFELEGALIRKGREEKWLYLGGSMAMGESVTAVHGGASGASESTSKGVSSYIERMRARREERLAKPVEPPKYTGEELQKHLREYNMELIRSAAKGETKGPPLPIPLTEDEDKQLVEEGVLPPRSE